jgi:hypothetical protein
MPIPKLRGSKQKPKKGLVPAGYDFLGPFNDMIVGPGRNQADEAARWHDIEYGKQGVKSYFMNSKADAEFIQDTENTPGFGNIANKIFKAKAAIAPNFVTPDQPKRKSDHSGISPAKKKLKMSSDDQDMEQAAPLETAMVMARGMASAPGTLGNGETPVDKWQTPHYGLPKTTTVILPITTYFTPVTFGDFKTIVCQFRMNSPYDCSMRSLGTPTPGSAIAEGVYNVQPGTGTTWPNPAVTYPTTNALVSLEAPQWRDYYDKLYQKYTVLGCEFTLTVMNPRHARGRDVTIAHGFDAFSAANGGRVFPQEKPLNDMEFWPGLKWHVIQSSNDETQDGTITTIRGRYRPGQVERNVQNDEDVKTWTNVKSTPLLTEALTLFFGRASFNGNADKVALKCKMQLKYIVQYKDPKVEMLYPATGQTAFTLNIPTDVLSIV